jgi:hypothetical protein
MRGTEVQVRSFLASSCPETGLWAISLQLNDHTDRGVGGRQYGTSKDMETPQG